MTTLVLATVSATWLGILTSISPCPLTANVAAMSYLAKRVGSPRLVLVSGLAYSLGRSLVYVTVAGIVVTGLLSAPQVSDFLQKHVNLVLGPVLILTGMLMVDLITIGRLGRGGISQFAQQRAERGGVGAAMLLGVLLALAFCPVSAAIYFGTLLPLSVKHQSRILLPLFYGLGTALPVIAFGWLVAAGAKSIGTMFNRVKQIELWARRITGALFIVIGIYYCLVYIFGFMPPVAI